MTKYIFNNLNIDKNELFKNIIINGNTETVEYFMNNYIIDYIVFINNIKDIFCEIITSCIKNDYNELLNILINKNIERVGRDPFNILINKNTDIEEIGYTSLIKSKKFGINSTKFLINILKRKKDLITILINSESFKNTNIENKIINDLLFQYLLDKIDIDVDINTNKYENNYFNFDILIDNLIIRGYDNIIKCLFENKKYFKYIKNKVEDILIYFVEKNELDMIKIIIENNKIENNDVISSLFRAYSMNKLEILVYLTEKGYRYINIVDYIINNKNDGIYQINMDIVEYLCEFDYYKELLNHFKF